MDTRTRAEKIGMILVVLNYLVRHHGLDLDVAETHLWIILLWSLIRDVAQSEERPEAA